MMAEPNNIKGACFSTFSLSLREQTRKSKHGENFEGKERDHKKI